ncbi:MAG: response regulator transcription factor [Defluviitaleaceae bacterium]|nr:response regulator transcription factor [Defluviitaleaceae bacterium]
MINILLAEDNEEIQLVNKNMLEEHGYAVRLAANLAEARTRLAATVPDIIILDIMLPDGNGLDFLQELKQGASANVPVLLLTALKTNKDQAKGLRAGGDDYLSKPYDYDIFLARIEALLRRSKSSTADILAFGRLSINTVEQRAYSDGTDLLLKPKQYALLYILARQAGQIVSGKDLYERVWGLKPVESNRSLISAVSRLRVKLEGSGYTIETVRNKGYVFAREV